MRNPASWELTIRTAGPGGFDIHVTVTGAGTPVLVFMHYWGGSARTWQPVTEQLASEYRCIAYDHRGWSLSGAPETGFAIGDLVHDFFDLAAALDLNDFVLVGHSMGGKVAQAVAALKPAGLVGLVLVAPAPAKPAVILTPQEQQQLLGAYKNRDSVRFAVEHVLTHRPPADALVEQIITDSLAGIPQATIAWPTHAINEDVSVGVSEIDVPTLVVAGEHDLVEPVTLLAEHVTPSIPAARLEVVSDSGHLIPLEQPEQLARLINAFISSLQPIKE